MASLTKAIKTKVLSKTKTSFLKNEIAKSFLNEHQNSIEKEDASLFYTKMHTLKSFDGKDLFAYETLVEKSLDTILIVGGFNDSINSTDNIANYFLNKNINVVQLETRDNLFDYAKQYLDIVLWANYFRNIKVNGHIYLYGVEVGANMCASALKTDIKNVVDAIVFDNIDFDYVERLIKQYCLINNYSYNKSLFNNINKLSINKKEIDLSTYLIEDSLKENTLPIFFIESEKESSKQFLRFYNSTKGIKKILYLDEKVDENYLEDAYNRLINALTNI